METRKYSKSVIILFLLLIFGFTAVTFVWPDRTFSENENRVLASAPEFSWENLFEGKFMSDYETLECIGKWLGYMWKGIQYSMLHKPEVIRMSHHRIPKQERDEAKKSNHDNKRVVKVQRVITIIDDGESEITISNDGYTITLPVWSVAGHWRTLASGRKVWVRPHLKGKDRDKQGVFCHKEYRFVEEDE